MSRRIRSTPTRLNLLRSRRRLERVQEGAELLRRKREALVRELLSHAHPAIDAREGIAREAASAYPALLDALAREGRAGVVASAEPLPEISVDVATTRLWGLSVGTVQHAPVLRRGLQARGTSPPLTSPATIEAADRFETLAHLLLEAAPREMILRRLGRAVARTSRQVQALERRVEPALEDDITRIASILDEREREDHLRLRRFLRRSSEPTWTSEGAIQPSWKDHPRHTG